MDDHPRQCKRIRICHIGYDWVNFINGDSIKIGCFFKKPKFNLRL